MKYWRKWKRSPSTHPTPTRKAAVPVPPASPVVSVSRKTARRRSKASSAGWPVRMETAAGSSARSRVRGTAPWSVSRWTSSSTRKNSPRGFSTRRPWISSSRGAPGTSAGAPLGRRAATATRRSSRSFSVSPSSMPPSSRASSRASASEGGPAGDSSAALVKSLLDANGAGPPPRRSRRSRSPSALDISARAPAGSRGRPWRR